MDAFTRTFFGTINVKCCHLTREIYVIWFPTIMFMFGAFFMILNIHQTHHGIVIDNHFSYNYKDDVVRYYCKVQYDGKTCENVAIKNNLVKNKNGDDDTYWKNRFDDVTMNDIMQNYADMTCKINSTLRVYDFVFVGDCGYTTFTDMQIAGIVFLILGSVIVFLWIWMSIFKCSFELSHEQIEILAFSNITQTTEIRQQIERLLQNTRELIMVVQEQNQPHALQQSAEQIDTFNETEQITCSICLIDFDNIAEQTILRCKHKFHTKCIFNCFINKNECPICKRKHTYADCGENGAENV